MKPRKAPGQAARKSRKPGRDDRFAGQIDAEAISNQPTLQSGPIFHPLANMFPLLLGAEFTTLAADIKQHGLREPIVRYEGMILDGRNRYRACLRAGVEPRYQEIEFADRAAAIAYVISANIHRRHLTRGQKRKAIANLLKADPDKSDRQIAEAAKADHKTVAKVRTEEEGRGEIPHVNKRKDRKGRQQPASKPPKKTPVKSAPAAHDGQEQRKTNADGTPIRRIAAPPRYTPRDTDDLPAVADAANAFNHELMGFLKAFEPDLKAWLQTKPTENGIDMMYKALNIAAEELHRMAGDVMSAALSISEKAEADNAVPPNASAEAMKAKFAATEDQSIPEGIHQTQTEATDAIERAAGGKA